MADVNIRVRDAGPLLVEGPITLVDAEGNAFTIPAGKPARWFINCAMVIPRLSAGAAGKYFANESDCDSRPRSCAV